MKSIITRKSIRTFTGEALSELHRNKILEYINNERNMTGIHNNIIRVELRETNGSIGGNIGTYGMIKRAPAFLVLIAKNSKENSLDCGYVFEKMGGNR